MPSRLAALNWAAYASKERPCRSIACLPSGMRMKPTCVCAAMRRATVSARPAGAMRSRMPCTTSTLRPGIGTPSVG